MTRKEVEEWHCGFCGKDVKDWPYATVRIEYPDKRNPHKVDGPNTGRFESFKVHAEKDTKDCVHHVRNLLIISTGTTLKEMEEIVKEDKKEGKEEPKKDG